MFFRVIMAAMLLFSCQLTENTAEVKNTIKAIEADFVECIEDITQNEEDTLRKTEDDPNCELTESNCIYIPDLNNAPLVYFLMYKRNLSGESLAMQLRIMDRKRDVQQRFTFSDLEACKCMRKNKMTFGFEGNAKVVRIGFGNFASSSSDRHTFKYVDDEGKTQGVDDVYIQLLPDSEEVKPHTYEYCRLKITGHKFTKGTYDIYHQFLGDDGNLAPQEGSRPVDGLITAEGDGHDGITLFAP